MTLDLNAQGPFNTEHEVLGAVDPWPSLCDRRQKNQELLDQALTQSHVEPGAYGRVVVDWLSGASTQTVAVIADIIIRANRPEQTGN